MTDDKQRFSCSLPLFAVPIHPRFDSEGGFIFDDQSRFLGAKTETGKRIIFLFTNDNIAFSHGIAHKIIPFESIQFDMPEQLLAFCGKVRELSLASLLALDPKVAAQPVATWQLDEFIACLSSLLASN